MVGSAQIAVKGKITKSAPVAQWIEQLPSKPLVAGSSPVGRAKFSFFWNFWKLVNLLRTYPL